MQEELLGCCGDLARSTGRGGCRGSALATGMKAAGRRRLLETGRGGSWPLETKAGAARRATGEEDGAEGGELWSWGAGILAAALGEEGRPTPGAGGARSRRRLGVGASGAG